MTQEWRYTTEDDDLRLGAEFHRRAKEEETPLVRVLDDKNQETREFRSLINSAQTYVIIQTVFAFAYAAQAVVMAILASVTEDGKALFALSVHTIITFFEIVILGDTFDGFYPKTAFFAKIKDAWIVFVMFVLAALMSLANAVDVHLQIKHWQRKRSLDTALVHGERPFMWLGRMLILGMFYPLVAQQAGILDIQLQVMIGCFFVIEAMLWWKKERDRGRDAAFASFLALFTGIAPWSMIAWSAVDSAKESGSRTNTYSPLILAVGFFHWVAALVLQLVDLYRTPRRENGTRIDFVILYAMDTTLFIGLTLLSWLGYVELTQDIPRITSPLCFPNPTPP